MRFGFLALIGLVALAGCTQTEVTADQAKAIAAESTPAKFDAEMKRQGKGDELAAAKKREEDYKNAGKAPGSESKSDTPNDPNVNP